MIAFFHLDIRCLSRSFGNLTNLFANIKTKFSISIGITETWLRDKEHTVDIGGYNFVHNCRTNKAGGGVGLYLKPELEYDIRLDLTLHDMACVESVFVEISRPKGKNIIVGVIYKPPNQSVDELLKILIN